MMEKRHIRQIVESVLRQYINEKNETKENGEYQSKTGDEKKAMEILNDPKINKTELGAHVCPKNWKKSTISSYMSKLGNNNKNPRDAKTSLLKKVNNEIDKSF